MRCALYLFAFSVYLSYTKAFPNSCSVRNTTRNISDYSITTDIIYDLALNECKCDLCVRKCCDVNYILNYDKVCVYNVYMDSFELKVPVFKYRNVMSDKQLDSTGLIYGWMKCTLDNETYRKPFIPEFYVQEDGRLWIWWLDKYLDYEHYCLDYNQRLEVEAHVCINRKESESIFMLNTLIIFGELISLPFLLATFIIYVILPLKNFHGKSLMCYVFSLFGAYSLEVFMYFYSVSMGVRCRLIVMVFYYFYIASFFWMNVMCLDIWLTFSDARGLKCFRIQPKRKRFLFYFVYAWSVPLVCIILILGISQVAEPNTWYNPGVVGQQCWITEGIPTFLYSNLPQVAVVIANIILFAATAYNIRKIQKDTAILRENGNRMSRYTSDKQRFKVYLKLFLAMGINMSVTVIAWIVKWQVENVPAEIWYIPELCNAAFGVFIFFTFVFKKKIWRLLRKRCCNKSEKSHFNKVMSTTATSRMTKSPNSTTAVTNS